MLLPGKARLWRMRILPRIITVFLVVIALGSCAIMIWPAFPRDHGGGHATDPLHAWFDQLASGKGLCCSFADGVSVQDVDWDTREGRYRVRLHGEWILVPDNALVTEPNRAGVAIVWPYLDSDGMTQIRCFLPGTEG